MNFKLTIQYDGTDFHGWQIQNGQRSVQGELTSALSLIDNREVTVHGSGRTDAGVHAEGQVASVFVNRELSGEKLRSAINGNIGSDVRVLNAEPVSDDFHARYSVIQKTYVYRIVNAPVISPFWSRYALHEARTLDPGKMHNCAKLFLGEHDWTAFSAAQSDVESRVRTITDLDVETFQDRRACGRILQLKVSANGFLRYMVRSIAGALLAVGRGEIDMQVVADAIVLGKRPLEIVTAPAHGLTLLSVKYIEDF
jgi:tRNA pseudouridine38-40 synthase